MVPGLSSAPQQNTETAKDIIENVITMADQKSGFSRREDKIFRNLMTEVQKEPAALKNLEVTFGTAGELSELEADIFEEKLEKNLESTKRRARRNSKQDTFYQTTIDLLLGLDDNSLETADNSWNIEKYRRASKTDIVKHARKNPQEVTDMFVTQNGNEWTWDFKDLGNASIALGNWAIPGIMKNEYAVINGNLYTRGVSSSSLRPGFFDKNQNPDDYLDVWQGTTFQTYASAAELPKEFKDKQTELLPEQQPLAFETYQKEAEVKLNAYENLVETFGHIDKQMSKEMQKQAVSAANELGISPAIFLAITEKESGGNLGATRFEEHVYKEQIAKGIPETEARMLATSYGSLQIMGYNYQSAGYPNVLSFVTAMQKENYSDQLKAAKNYIKVRANGALLQAMQQNPPDFETIAKLYNGPNYKENKYDTDIQNKYLRYQSNFRQTPEKLWAYFDPLKQIQPQLDQLKQQYPTPGKRVAAIAELIANNKNIIGEHCWHWASLVYEAAGVKDQRVFNSRKYSKNTRDPEEASNSQLSTLSTGDWIFLNNGNSADKYGDHSGIFIKWHDKENNIAEIANCPGSNQPGTKKLYNISANENGVTRIKNPVV